MLVASGDRAPLEHSLVFPYPRFWIYWAVWVGKHLKYLPAHDISRSIGEEKSQALLAFYAFTGCYQTSSFAHYGKKTAREIWGAFGDVTAAFQALSNAPTVDVLAPDAYCWVLRVTDRHAWSYQHLHESKWCAEGPVTSQNVIITTKCNTNAKCDKKKVNAKCNNFSSAYCNNAKCYNSQTTCTRSRNQDCDSANVILT